MKITPTEHGLELARSAPGYVRGQGLHMSDIYNALFQELEPKRYIKGTAPDPLRLEAGLAFEELLEAELKKRLGGPERPGELEGPHGILFSPDMIAVNGVHRVVELKLTWLSSRDVPRDSNGEFPPKFDKYFCQIKAYCKCLDTRYGRLIVFFVNGDYKPPKPCLLAWDLEFTDQEIEENWSLLMNFAREKGMI